MRDAVRELGQVPGEVGVPGVAVDEVGALDAGGHREVDRHRLQRGACGRAASAVPRPVARRGRRRAVARPSSARRGRRSARELARQVLDVHARAAVDLRRVLAGEQRDPHASTRGALADHDDAARRDTVKRSRSASGSTPICAPGSIAHVLVEDRAAHDGVAADVDAVHQHRALDLRVASARARPGERIERRTVPPETTTPAQTIESSAWPARPSSSKTNLAGGSGSGQVRIGQSLVVEVEDRDDARSGPCARRSRRRASRRRASSRASRSRRARDLVAARSRRRAPARARRASG